MLFNARYWPPPAAALVTATILLAACARVGSEVQMACPPVVEYSRADQGQLANELASLPEGALIVDWLADYAVLREQVRACAR